MNEAMIVSWAGMGTKIKSEFGYWVQILENLSETSALLSKLFLDTKVYNIRLLHLPVNRKNNFAPRQCHIRYGVVHCDAVF